MSATNGIGAGSGSGARREPGTGLGSMFRTSLALMGMTGALKLAGFIEKLVLAACLGVSVEADALLLAISIPLALNAIVREVAEPVLVPRVAVEDRAGRPDRARALLVGLMVASVLVTFAVVVAVLAAPDTVARVLAPGLPAAATTRVATLLAVTMPAAPVLAAGALVAVYLVGTRRFVQAATGDFFLKLGPMAAVLLMSGTARAPVLAAGFLVGAVGRLAVNLVMYGRAVVHAWRVQVASVVFECRNAGPLVVPVLLGTALSQARGIAEMSICSLAGAGNVAANAYARKLIDVPLLLIPGVLSIVALPAFSLLAASANRRRFWSRISTLLLLTVLGFTFVAAAFLASADPLVTVLLRRGAFDETAVSASASLLRVYSIGLPAMAAEALIVTAFYSVRDVRTPFLAGVVATLLEIALALAVTPMLGVSAVATAYVLTRTGKAIALWLLLRRRLGACARTFGPAAVAGVLVGATASAFLMRTVHLMLAGRGEGVVGAIALLAATASVGAVVYFAGLALAFPRLARRGGRLLRHWRNAKTSR